MKLDRVQAFLSSSSPLPISQSYCGQGWDTGVDPPQLLSSPPCSVWWLLDLRGWYCYGFMRASVLTLGSCISPGIILCFLLRALFQLQAQKSISKLLSFLRVSQSELCFGSYCGIVLTIISVHSWASPPCLCGAALAPASWLWLLFDGLVVYRPVSYKSCRPALLCSISVGSSKLLNLTTSVTIFCFSNRNFLCVSYHKRMAASVNLERLI
jgi:hypothetical protein